MKILIVSSVFPNTIANMYDEAVIQYKMGADVTIVDCDSSIGICWHNPSHNKNRCNFCEKYRKQLTKQIPDGIKKLHVRQFLTRNGGNRPSYDYENVKDIKDLTYKGVKLGLCCLSIYISVSRNNSPLIDDKFRIYFNFLLNRVKDYIDAMEVIIDNEKPDKIVVFNGRCTNSRPVIEIADRKGIPFVCSEVISVFKGQYIRRYFYNAMPHNIVLNTKMISETWDNASIPENDKILLGKRFYESKLLNLFNGDKNYTEDQIKGKLPNNWDKKKYNIVIFNSSEDEFAAIGKEYEEKSLFESQFKAIEFIVNNIKGRDDINVYLKIHPNLKDIKYKYHLDLYGFSSVSNNFFIIEGSSDVSTYQMMKDCDKVIVFNSTAGPEAAYQRKPVITLNGALYYLLGFTYTPKDEDEFRKMLLDKNLEPLYNENVLKFGFYFMNYFLPSAVFFDIGRENRKIFGKLVSLYPHKKLLGSRFLHRLYENLGERISILKRNYIPIPRNEK